MQYTETVLNEGRSVEDSFVDRVAKYQWGTEAATYIVGNQMLHYIYI